VVWGGFFLRRTASLLVSLREAARKVPKFAPPIILAYGTYASAKFSRHSARRVASAKSASTVQKRRGKRGTWL